ERVALITLGLLDRCRQRCGDSLRIVLFDFRQHTGMCSHGDRVPELFRGFGRARGEHGHAAAVLAHDPPGFFHSALLVRSDGEPEVPCVDIGTVLGQYDFRAGCRDSFHTDRDFHWSLLSRDGSIRRPRHAFIRSSSGSNIGVRPTLATVAGYRSPMYSTNNRVPPVA